MKINDEHAVKQYRVQAVKQYSVCPPTSEFVLRLNSLVGDGLTKNHWDRTATA
jgi:hypothetical protein